MPFAPKDYAEKSQELDDVFQAVADLRPVRCTHARADGQLERVVLLPYAMLLYKDAVYFIAARGDDEPSLDVPASSRRVAGAGRVETFLLDRISDTQCLVDRRFALPDGFDVRDYLQGQFGIWQVIGPARDVVIDFDARVAAFVRTRRVHASQRLDELEGGGVRMTLALGDLAEVATWVLGFGGSAKVIEAARARRARRRRARRCARSLHLTTTIEGSRPIPPRDARSRLPFACAGVAPCLLMASPMNLQRLAWIARRASGIAVSVLACACSGSSGGSIVGGAGGGSSATTDATSTSATSATSAAIGGAFGGVTPIDTVELCVPDVGGPGAAEISWVVCDLPFDPEHLRLAVDAEGDSFVTSPVDRCGANGCAVLEKIDPQGNVAWQLTATSQHPDGSPPTNGVDVRVDASDHVWLGLAVVGETTIGGATIPAALDPNGNVIAQPVLAQIDADGAVAATIVLPVSESTWLVDFAADAAGGLVVLANVCQDFDSVDHQLLANVDASGGRVWTQKIPADVGPEGAFERVQTTATGEVVIGGWAEMLDYSGLHSPGGLTGTVLAGFEASGTHTWVRNVAGSFMSSFTLDAAQVLVPNYDTWPSDRSTLVTFDVGRGDFQDKIPLPGVAFDGDVTMDATGELLLSDSDNGSGDGAWVLAVTTAGVVTWRAYIVQGYMTSVAANQAASIVGGSVTDHAIERAFVAKLNR